MICSSENLTRFIVCPSLRPDSNRSWRKIRGSRQLQDAGAKVSEQEAAEAEAERLAKRRAAAVEVLRFLPERDAISAKANEMLTALAEALDEVRKANSRIAGLVSDCGGRESDVGTVFVKLEPAADYRILDTLQAQLASVLRVTGEGCDLGGAHPAFRVHALETIARMLPDVRDPAVQAESGAAIDPAFLPN